MTNQNARQNKARLIPSWRPVLACLCLTWPAVVPGEIYRYQDESGNWHFADEPSNRFESSLVPGIATGTAPSRSAKPAEDLAARLESAFNPITPIAYATLAVVSIKTDTGEGSGFFCSREGHILTSRHVIRPAPAEAEKDRGEAFEDREEELRTLEASLREARGELKLMERELQGFDELIESARDRKTRSQAADARERLSLRYRTTRVKVSNMARNVRSIKKELRTARLSPTTGRGLATEKTRFDIVLKDGTEIVASLVDTSDAQDLALLKVEGFATPFLRVDPSLELSQGTRVFAIGSPLGVQDAVTSGVVTQTTPRHLLTDAQILPGSSGGPLILESGEVVGVNAVRKVAAGTSMYAAGFGEAIPIYLAMREFPGAIEATEPRAVGWEDTEGPVPGQIGSFGSGQAGRINPRRDAVPGATQEQGFAPGQRAASGQGRALSVDELREEAFVAGAVRLVLPQEDGAPGMEAFQRPEPRSLDFPPEGNGIPPGISGPRN
jgi:S1-C subfamily serine protease